MKVSAVSESEMAMDFMRAVRLYETRYPLLGRIFHVPNGGKRTPQAGMKLKAEGVKRGVYDYLLIYKSFFRREQFNGLAIELKAKGGLLSAEQKQFAIEIAAEGWYVVDCWDADAAFSVLTAYLALPKLLSVTELKINGWKLPHE